MPKRVYTDANASVRFCGETLDPLDITAALHLPPDHTHRKGEQVLGRSKSGAVREVRSPYPDGMWSMSSRGVVRSPRLSVHIEWLLSELEPKADAIRELLGRGVAADIFCYSAGMNRRPPAIPRSLRARAQALGLRIEIDHSDVRPCRAGARIPSASVEPRVSGGQRSDAHPMDRKKGRQRYKALVAAVKAAVDGADPIGLLSLGCPADEYDPEVGTIVPRAAKASDVGEVHRIVHEEFCRWFGHETAGPASAYEAPARHIWEAVRAFRTADASRKAQ